MILCLAILAMVFLPPRRVDARCRSIVIRVAGTLTKSLGADRALVLRPSPDALSSRTTIEVDGGRFVATVDFYPGGSSKAGEEDCSLVPQYVSVAVVSGGEERTVARLAFPADFRNVEGTIWRSRKTIRVFPDASRAVQ